MAFEVVASCAGEQAQELGVGEVFDGALVEFGLAGWELAAVEGVDNDATYYMKQPIPER